jgi:hypothetical protein
MITVLPTKNTYKSMDVPKMEVIIRLDGSYPKFAKIPIKHMEQPLKVQLKRRQMDSKFVAYVSRVHKFPDVNSYQIRI